LLFILFLFGNQLLGGVYVCQAFLNPQATRLFETSATKGVVTIPIDLLLVQNIVSCITPFDSALFSE